MQKVIIRCWISSFGKIQLSGSENKSIIWIYKWTRWTTRWQPTQFSWVLDFHWTVPKLTVRVYWRPTPSIWQQFSSNLNPDPKRQSGTVANTTGKYLSCSAPQGIGSESHVIAYWLSSTSHVSRFPATAVSSPLSIVWMNVLRNNWHHYKPWRLIDWPRLLHHRISSTVVCEHSMNPLAMRLAVKSTRGL